MRLRSTLLALLCLTAASLSSAARLALAQPPRPVGQPPPASETALGFDYGSYGRVGLGSDLRGHEGYPTNVVSHGSRLELPPYIELNFYYTGLIGGDPKKFWRVVVVPAFASGNLFHYTGTVVSHLALRNAYAETENLGLRGLKLWIGSRMYRGDDIYLFNYWPLDNLNTVGGGAIYDWRKTTAALHIGLNRLDSLYQYQTLDVPPRGLGPPGQATVLDRPRLVTSLKLQQRFGELRGAKIALYGELHALPEGELTDPTTRRKTPLPEDFGWVAGAQLGGWLRPNVFLNAWVRVAGGLAAFGELSVPTSLDRSRRVTGAREIVGALNLNWESRWVGIMAAGYVRRFLDPAPGDFNPDSYTEGIVAARPHLYIGRYFQAAVELSYQARRADGQDFLTGRVLAPQVFRFSILPLVAPLGPGTYSRPQLYLVYTVSKLNDDARLAMYDPLDFRYSHTTVHYLGAGVEWWFNSSYR